MSKSKNTAKVQNIETIADQPIVERVRPPKDEKGRFKTVDMTMEEIQALNFKTKSAQIRYLSAAGYSPMAISKFMGVIYQHVRNVLTQELKKPTTTPAAPATAEQEGDETAG